MMARLFPQPVVPGGYNHHSHARYNWRCHVRLWSLRYEREAHVGYGETINKRRKRPLAT